MLLLVAVVPLHPGVLLTSLVFLSQAAVTVSLIPVGGTIAHTVAEERKGSASGWYQAGSLAGMGVGGGAGVWLVTHSTVATSGAALAGAMLIWEGFLGLAFIGLGLIALGWLRNVEKARTAGLSVQPSISAASTHV